MRITALLLHTFPRIAICLILALWAFSYHWLAGLISCLVLLPVAGSFWGDYLSAKIRNQEVPRHPSVPYQIADQPKSGNLG
jgi:hypothetical protein